MESLCGFRKGQKARYVEMVEEMMLGGPLLRCLTASEMTVSRRRLANPRV